MNFELSSGLMLTFSFKSRTYFLEPSVRRTVKLEHLCWIQFGGKMFMSQVYCYQHISKS